MKTLSDWIQGVLLAGGCTVQVLVCLRLLLTREPLDALHRVAPASMAGAPLVCAAILLNEAFSPGGIHALLIGGLLIASGPVVTHAIARAVRLRETQGLMVLPSERPEDA